MKPFARELPVLELGEGSVVAGYRVGASMPRRSSDERVHEVLSSKGRPATIVFARRGGDGRAGKTRFRRLARSRARLEHPALIRVHEFGDLDSFRYLVSDPYPPRTFADRLDEGPVSPRDAIGLLAPVATALDLAHAAGVVHQSLAAESLLRVGDHLIIDTFSLAGGGVDPVFGSSRGGAHPLYISPEAGRDEAVEPASNVYSLAAIMVHALTGRPPFEGDAASVVYAHLVEGPPRPSERGDGLPEAIDGVIATGMAKDPALRQRKAMSLLQAAATALDVPFHPLQGQAFRPGKVRAPSRRVTPAKQPDRDSLARESPSSPRRPGGSRARPAPPVPRRGDRLGTGLSPRPPASKPRIPDPEPRVAGSKSPAVRSNGAAAPMPKRPSRLGRPPAGVAAKRAGATAVGAAKTGATKAWAATVVTAAAVWAWSLAAAAAVWAWSLAAAAAVWALAKRAATTGWPMAKRAVATLWAWAVMAVTTVWALVRRSAASGWPLAKRGVVAVWSWAEAAVTTLWALVRRSAASGWPLAKRGAATLGAWAVTAVTTLWAFVKGTAARGSALAAGAATRAASAASRGAATAGSRAKRGAARAGSIAKRPTASAGRKATRGAATAGPRGRRGTASAPTTTGRGAANADAKRRAAPARPVAKRPPATAGTGARRATAAAARKPKKAAAGAGPKPKTATATATAGAARGAGKAASRSGSARDGGPARMPSLAALARRVRPGRAWALAIPVVAVGLMVGVLLASGGGADETAARPDPVTARNARLVNALEDQRLDLRAGLVDADSAPDQAKAAIALATAYRSTAGEAPSRALASSAEQAAVAYEELAAAARREDGGLFAEASRGVDAAEEGFQATAGRVLGRP